MSFPSGDGGAPQAPNATDLLAEDLSPFCLGAEASIRAAMSQIDVNGEGMVLAVDDGQRLVGVVTDGDIRRAIIRGTDLGRPIADILAFKQDTPMARPIVERPPISWQRLVGRMQDKSIRQIPIVGDNDVLLGLALYSRIARHDEMPVRAVIMAGGFGTRLRPLTVDTPKPMLPIKGKPIIEHIVGNLQTLGIRNLTVTTHYLPEKIRDHLGDGSRFGVDIGYAHEDEPQGTAGALRKIERHGDDPVLVMNGDILTNVDFRSMLDFHRENNADFTVGVRMYEFQVPYGVVEVDGPRVVGLTEKPTTRVLVNAGIYLMQPHVLDLIPADGRFDMTDLIQALMDRDRTVCSFPIFEYWIDVGRPEDYLRAEGEYLDRKDSVQ